MTRRVLIFLFLTAFFAAAAAAQIYGNAAAPKNLLDIPAWLVWPQPVLLAVTALLSGLGAIGTILQLLAPAPATGKQANDLQRKVEEVQSDVAQAAAAAVSLSDLHQLKADLIAEMRAAAASGGGAGFDQQAEAAAGSAIDNVLERDDPLDAPARTALEAADILGAADRLVEAARADARRAAERYREAGALAYPLNAGKALAAYRAAADLDPSDFWTHIFVARLALVTGTLDQSLAAANAALGATSGERQKSVALNELGDARRARNDLSGALDAYEEGLVISRRLAAADPSDAERQRDVTVTLNNVGDVRRARNDLSGALDAYEEGLTIRRRLAAADPSHTERQRDVLVSLTKIGDVRRARNDLSGALDAYEEGLAIARRLAAADPSHAERQRDASVSLERVGDVRRARNDLSGALDAYEEGLTIARRLAAADRSHAERQRDVSVSLNKLGDVRRARNDLSGALEAYEEGLTIRRRLAAADPSHAGRQRDVWTSLWRISLCTATSGRWLEVVQEIDSAKQRGLFNPVDEPFYLDARRLAGL